MAPQLVHFEEQDLVRLAEDAEKWTNSPQGAQAIQQSIESASETIAFLAAERCVDPQRIREPLTL